MFTHVPRPPKRFQLRATKTCFFRRHESRRTVYAPTGPTAASLHLANDIVHSSGHCLGLRRRLRFARDSLRAVRSMRSFHAVLSKFIVRTAMCSRGARQYGRACLLTRPADLLARCPARRPPTYGWDCRMKLPLRRPR